MRQTILVYCLIPLAIAGVAYTISVIGLRAGVSGNDKSLPCLECPSELDLGARDKGEIVSVRFAISNRGATPLVIDPIRSSCSCTILERNEGGRSTPVRCLTLQPKGSADLDLQIRVDGPIGQPMRYVIELHTNDANRPVHHIEALVTSVRGGVFSSPTSIIFGSVSAGQEVRRITDILDDSTLAHIDHLESSNPERVSVRLLPPVAQAEASSRDHPAVIGRIEVAVSANTHGEIDESVRVHIAGKLRQPLVVPVMGKVVGPVEVVPPKLVLPQVSGSGPLYSGVFLLRSPDGRATVITEKTAPPGFTVEYSADEKVGPTLVRITWDRKVGAALADTTAYVRLRVLAGNTESTLVLPVTCVGESRR